MEIHPKPRQNTIPLWYFDLRVWFGRRENPTHLVWAPNHCQKWCWLELSNFELVRISLLVICAVIFWSLTKDLRITIAFKNEGNREIRFYKVVWLFILSTLLGRNTETPTNPIWQSNPIFAGVYVSCKCSKKWHRIRSKNSDHNEVPFWRRLCVQQMPPISTLNLCKK